MARHRVTDVTCKPAEQVSGWGPILRIGTWYRGGFKLQRVSK
jgi:hypothetical protein